MSRNTQNPKQSLGVDDEDDAIEAELNKETVRDFDPDRNDVRASANTEDGAHHGDGFATRSNDVNFDDYDRDDDARLDSDDTSTPGNSDGSNYGYRRSYGQAEGMSQDEPDLKKKPPAHKEKNDGGTGTDTDPDPLK